ncbi:unnamed protein product, partial [Prorocentrum cordatum]
HGPAPAPRRVAGAMASGFAGRHPCYGAVAGGWTGGERCPGGAGSCAPARGGSGCFGAGPGGPGARCDWGAAGGRLGASLGGTWPPREATWCPELPEGVPVPPRQQAHLLPSPAAVQAQRLAYERPPLARAAGHRRAGARGQGHSAAARRGEDRGWLEIDRETLEREARLDEQTCGQVLALHREAANQGAQLEQRAHTLLMDYRQRRIHDTHALERYEAAMRLHALQAQAMQGAALQAQLGAAQAHAGARAGASPAAAAAARPPLWQHARAPGRP